MQLQIKIEDENLILKVGKGFNEWVWLAHYAARVYSKSIYPQGTYLPTLLYLENIKKQTQYYPHPKEQIKAYMQNYDIRPVDVICVVQIKKVNYAYSELEKKWEKQAYGQDQYFQTYKFTYLANNINRKRDFYLLVKTDYSMAPQVKHLFDANQYPSQITTHLKDIHQRFGANQSKFQAELMLPLGKSKHRLFYYERESDLEQYSEIELSEKKIKKNDFLIQEEPIYMCRQQKLQQISQHMKIEENISKKLQQKEAQTKKRNASTSLCCFTFQQLWQILIKNYKIQLSLDDYQSSTIQRIKLCIEKYMNQLYEIFFYYFVIENQQKDKKEQLGALYQDVMHFLRDYRVMTDMQNLTNFFEFYNADQGKFKKIEDTLDINNHAVKFPQFMAILLRSVQFVQTSTFLMKGQTYDTAVNKIFQKIIEVQSQLGEFSEFRRNLRQNPKIISFVRSCSVQLKNIYIWMCKKSIQARVNPFIIMKEEIKQLLRTFNLLEKNSNVDKLLNECFRDLKLQEYEQEGIFYYEFITVIQWLAMALVSDEKQDQIQNQDDEVLMIIEKMKYFLEKIQMSQTEHK